MSTRYQAKPFALGLNEDVGKLLSSFAKLKTTDFPAFASLWKKHRFSLIFMGRPDELELSEFTNEAFKVASQYLLSNTFFYEVGAIFLLYALYRNQISQPPIMIRIDLQHWKVIDKIHKEAKLKLYKTLLYVINFLNEHALVFVACQKLEGPTIATVHAEPKNLEAHSSLKFSYKNDITEYMASNNVELLSGLYNEYTNVKKKLDMPVHLSISDRKDIYSRFQKELETLVQPDVGACIKEEMEKESIGARRARIKEKSFSGICTDMGEISMDHKKDREKNENPNHEPTLQSKKLHGKYARARTLKKGKTIGRPPKNPPPAEESKDSIESEVHFSIKDIPGDEEGFYYPSKSEATGIRYRASRLCYYEKMPKKLETEEGNISTANEEKNVREKDPSA